MSVNEYPKEVPAAAPAAAGSADSKLVDLRSAVRALIFMHSRAGILHDQTIAANPMDDLDGVIEVLSALAEPSVVPAYWLAVQDGQVNFGMSTDDGNGGDAARSEINGWINDQMVFDPADVHSLVGFTPLPAKADEVAMDRARSALVQALSGALDCTRDWSAWGSGNMTQEDFVPVNEDDDRVSEILEFTVEALLTPVAPDAD